jgi:hypothetical protein
MLVLCSKSPIVGYEPQAKRKPWRSTVAHVYHKKTTVALKTMNIHSVGDTVNG